MATNNISFLGQNLAQGGRLAELNALLGDLQRQVTTQKRSETLAGLGIDATPVQRLRANIGITSTYINNIDVGTIRIKNMTDAMQEVIKLGQNLMGSINVQVREGRVDLEQIKTLARDGIAFMRDLMNTEVNGRYIFAGNDTSNEPYADLDLLNTNVSNELASWLSGGQSVAATLSNIDGYSSSQMGYSATVTTAGSIFIRADTTVEIDYTVKADSDGFQNILRGLSLAANLDLPDPSIDVGTLPEFHEILDHILSVTSSGINDMQNDQMGLGSKINLLDAIHDRLKNDSTNFQNMVSKVEDVDTTEAIIKLQALQQQLTASYQVTHTVSQLSLINFI